jgi:hypothetical protein
LALIRWCELNVGLALAFAAGTWASRNGAAKGVLGRAGHLRSRSCRKRMGGSPSARTFINCHGDCFVVHDLPRAPAPRTRPIEDSAIARAVRAGHNLPQGNCLLALAAHELPAATAFCRRRGTWMLRQQSAKTVWRLDSPAERGSLASEGRGRGFESLRVRQQFQTLIRTPNTPLRGLATT